MNSNIGNTRYVYLIFIVELINDSLCVESLALKIRADNGFTFGIHKLTEEKNDLDSVI